MPLIIEDGSIVENANSYLTVQEVRDFASARGYSLPNQDSEVEVLVIKAMDYLESLADKYKGVKTAPSEQELQWPRYDVYVEEQYVESYLIPKSIKNALAQCVVESVSAPLVSAPQPTVKKNKVDIIETEYFDSGVSRSEVDFTRIESFLAPLIKSSGFSIGVVRK